MEVYIEDHIFWNKVTYPTTWDEIGSAFTSVFDLIMNPVVIIMLTGVMIGVSLRVIRTVTNAA